MQAQVSVLEAEAAVGLLMQQQQQQQHAAIMPPEQLDGSCLEVSAGGVRQPAADGEQLEALLVHVSADQLCASRPLFQERVLCWVSAAQVGKAAPRCCLLLATLCCVPYL
jgi:hypothetical protein